MMPRTPAVAIALLAALLIAGCGGDSEQSGAPASSFNGDVNFKLPNASSQKLPAFGPGASGEVLPIRPQEGRLLLLFFGFTSCPDICPTAMAAMGAAVRQLPKAQQTEIEGAMVTVDPARDSGRKLKSYVAQFFSPKRAWGYRPADLKQLKVVERAFGASSEIDESESSEAHHEHDASGAGHKGGPADTNYDVAHSMFRYAINSRGEVVLMWQEGITSDEIAADLKRLLDQKSDVIDRATG